MSDNFFGPLDQQAGVTDDPGAPKTNRYSKALLSGGVQISEAAKELSKLAFTIKPILPETARIFVLYGPPGGGKSFVAIDMGLSISTGKDYHGHRVKKKSVLYVAAEGATGVLIRVRAWLIYHGLDWDALKNFHILTIPLRVDDPLSYAHGFAAIEKLVPKPEVIFLDTLARSMTGDENSTADMNRFVDATDTLGRTVGAQMGIVHHTGKDEKRGARGSIALTGATECMFKTLYKSDKREITMTCERQKDQEKDKAMVFRAELVQTDIINADGDEYNSLVPVLDKDLSKENSQKKANETIDKKDGLSHKDYIVMQSLREVLIDKGKAPLEHIADRMDKNGVFLPGDKVISEGDWCDHAIKCGIASEDAKPAAAKQAFRRSRLKLLRLNRVQTYEGYCWICTM